MIVIAIILIPIILSVLNIYFLFETKKYHKYIIFEKIVEYVTLTLGYILSLLLISVSDITDSDWNEVLYNDELHTPIWSVGIHSLEFVFFIGFICFLFLSYVNVQKIPPLISVLLIAGVYLTMILCTFWIIQIFSFDLNSDNFFLCILPFNYIIITAKIIRQKILDWKNSQKKEVKQYNNKFLNKLNLKLLNSSYWPIIAFILMWPILGIIICILVLCGQSPDILIKAWTETSDWNLSTQISPQNIIEDEHYLCTVAAGGHRKIVKPIRMGERHGHKVIVNRQLCIANAFEQVLEEKTPSFHRHLRHFYDTYGFPIAKLIHSPYAADIIYFIMKPLEWFFLIVLYCTDTNPENRIAVQYLPKIPVEKK